MNASDQAGENKTTNSVDITSGDVNQPDTGDIREQTDSHIDRFRKQWSKEGDEYYQDDVVADILALFTDKLAGLLEQKTRVFNSRDEYVPVSAVEKLLEELKS